MSGFRHAVLLVGAVSAVVLAGCSKSDDTQAAKPLPPPNVLLVIMDTTRADRLGCYGGPAELTPRLDELAAHGVRFAHAYSHAPWTLPSTASLLTSLYPTAHGAGERLKRGFTMLAENVPTIAEAFKSAGYQTASVINVQFLSQQYGMTNGFDHVDYYEKTTNDHMRPAADTTDAALSWLETRDRGKPFFLMVHYFDPHLTYWPPPEFRRRFFDDQDKEITAPLFGKRHDMTQLRRGKIDLHDLPIKRLEKMYNGEVAYTDQQIGRLLDRIKSMGLMDDLDLVVTADHGEEFLDHGGYEHGHTVFEELIHVPLILAGRDVPAGIVAGDVVGLIDVAPTLCHLAGITIPDSFVGESLVPAFERIPLRQRAIISEGNMWGPSWHAIREGNLKLIVSPDNGYLFDVVADPTEQNDIKRIKLHEGEKMHNDLLLLLDAMRNRRSGSAPEAQLTDAQREQLCALGYIDGCDP